MSEFEEFFKVGDEGVAEDLTRFEPAVYDGKNAIKITQGGNTVYLNAYYIWDILPDIAGKWGTDSDYAPL
jgi:hypothetical protein